MKKLFTFVAACVLLFACDKDKDEGATVCIDGVVRYNGDPAADGLGWVIYKGDGTTTQLYVPQQLADEFKVNGLRVATCLQQTNERVSCRCAEPPYKYRVTTIQRR